MGDLSGIIGIDGKDNLQKIEWQEKELAKKDAALARKRAEKEALLAELARLKTLGLNVGMN
jgi:hypothetical protein